MFCTKDAFHHLLKLRSGHLLAVNEFVLALTIKNTFRIADHLNTCEVEILETALKVLPKHTHDPLTI